MFVEAKVNGVYTKALVNIGASHNFVHKDETMNLVIQYTKQLDLLKVINSLSKPILDVAYGLHFKIAE